MKNKPISSFFYIFMLFFLLPFYDLRLIDDKWPIQSSILYFGFVVGSMFLEIWIISFASLWQNYMFLSLLFCITPFIGMWPLAHYILKRAKQLQNI